MAKPAHLLVIRFSALGDVAMTVPVIRLLLRQHPQLQITFLSNAFVAPLFDGIERCNFYPADLKGRHKGVRGLYILYKDLKHQFSFDAIADLHQVLRSKILRFFFTASGLSAASIDKGRTAKKALTRKEDKILQPLATTFERYALVFKQLGFPVQLSGAEGVTSMPDRFSVLENSAALLIGVAPFAQHAEKMYPPEKMKALLRMLVQIPKAKVLLFGGGKNETEALRQWEREIPGLESVAGTMNFQNELQLISRLHLMVSMDSANMHLASLSGVPVVSVWGATHPFAGFYGWGQSPKDAVQVDLYCRPCSVFGNKPCFRGDHACMHSIQPQTIYEKVIEKLNLWNS